MVIGGIQCTVYGKPKTVIDMAIQDVRDSTGRIRWYDYSEAYDVTSITMIIASEDGAGLEALVREQYQSETMAVTFGNDEWLYNYTGNFVIQKYTAILRSDSEYSEYGYEVTLLSSAVIDYRAITGSRVQCTGAGDIMYNGVAIPQPNSRFGFTYRTHRYAGATHGGAYLSGLPTITHDDTKIETLMPAMNMRALVDAMLTTRGAVFSVTFPANCYPFGLSRGGGGDTLTVSPATSKITIELVAGATYKTTLEVTAL